MTMNKAGHPPAIKARGFCGSCSYPMEGDICPECGGRPAERSRFNRTSRNVGWILALLAIAWGIEFATFSAINLLLPNMVSPASISMLMILSAIPHALGTMLLAVASLILLTGGWRLPASWKAFLLSLVLLFPTIAALSLLIWLLDFFSDRADLSLWMVPISSLETIGLVGLVAGIGACSRRNPGGSNRWFLSRAWIVLGIITALQISLGIMFRWIAMSNNPNPNLQLIQGLSSMLGVVMIGAFAFKITFVGFLVPWKRSLTECARDHGPISN